jgi:hypothetical protein
MPSFLPASLNHTLTSGRVIQLLSVEFHNFPNSSQVRGSCSWYRRVPFSGLPVEVLVVATSPYPFIFDCPARTKTFTVPLKERWGCAIDIMPMRTRSKKSSRIIMVLVSMNGKHFLPFLFVARSYLGSRCKMMSVDYFSASCERGKESIFFLKPSVLVIFITYTSGKHSLLSFFLFCLFV